MRYPGLGRWRLGTRLTVAVVLMALPLELIVLGTALSGLQERRAAELENAVLVGQGLAAVVDGFAGDLQSTTLALALSFGSQTGPLNQENNGEALRAVASQYPSLRAMFLTDASGRLVATGTGGELGFDLSSRPYMQALRGGAEIVWSGGIAGIQTGETTVAFGRTVRASNGSPRGYIIVAFYPQHFVESLPVSLPTDAQIAVVDERGNSLYASHLSEHTPEIGSSQAVQSALAGNVVRIVGQAEPLSEEPRFGVVVPLRRLGWAVAYTRPQAAVEEALRARTLFQAGGTALVIALAAAGMILVARRLTRPLTVLSETADAIARGEQPTIPRLSAALEVEQLGAAMRLMSAAVAEREADLTEQREWLRVTLASIGDAVLATDAQGRVTFLNAPAAELTGWTEKAALGRDVADVLRFRAEETGASAESPITRVLREGVVVGLANHTVLIARDGSEHPVEDSAAPIRDASGALIGVVMVFRDVSERRRAEDRLRESQHHLQMALVAAKMIAWEMDPDTGELTTSNNVPEVYGVSQVPNLAAGFTLVHPDDLPELQAGIARMRRTGESYHLEFRVVRPDTGEVVWQELHSIAIRNHAGEIVKLAGVVLDTTQRRTAEQALRESEERLRLAVDAAPILLFNHDRELRFTWVGKQLAENLPITALLGKRDDEIFPPEFATPAMALKRRALESGTRVVGELELPPTDDPEGTPRAWVLTVEPLRDASGEITGITCAAVDITERRALERLQQEFISMVSHELRNPLSSIKGYAQLLQRRGTYEERPVASIIQQGDHLDRLISDLLDSSRLGAGHLELRRRKVQLQEAVTAAVERAQNQTTRHTFRLALAEEPLVGFWDPERLDQILSNLLANAIKYSPDGGEIVVRVERNGKEGQVSVTDTGLGIAEEQLPRVFDRFYRATSTSTRVQGLGIGLYVSRELVEAHGGRIWVESAGVNQGSTFMFTMPLMSVSDPASHTDGPVLVVDDDDPLRDVITETLESEGYRVIAARDGREALERVEAEPPVLILLDWMMPHMNGEEFAAEMKRRELDASIPIVVMTAGGEARERAVKIGAQGFIRKPFELSLLLDQVARYIGHRPG